MRILVTGGPVHAHLDAIKVITNKFRGGRMLELAIELWRKDVEVTYLTSGMHTLPKIPGFGVAPEVDNTPGFNVIKHRGFDAYRRLVLEQAPEHDAVILGAAVCNLIPLHPLEGKFPSHDYKPGDVIPIEFQIAPRIIDEVKDAAPLSKLFGFKLLAGAPHDELIRAAYEIVLASRATAVFANDASDLDTKFAVFKDRSVHEVHAKSLARYIKQLVADRYYRTATQVERPAFRPELMSMLLERFEFSFMPVEEGLRFGAVAVRDRHDPSAFFTTVRGKKELSDWSYVGSVDHDHRRVFSCEPKPSLNAPLLHNIFKQLPHVKAIVHHHEQQPAFPVLPYAPPGTVRDSDRKISGSFNIEGHGCFILFDEDGCEI